MSQCVKGEIVWNLLPQTTILYNLLKSSASLRFLKSWECFPLSCWWMLSLDRKCLNGEESNSVLKVVKFSFSWCLCIPGNKLIFKQHLCRLLVPGVPLYWLRCLQLLYFSFWLLAVGWDTGWKHLSAGCEESKVSHRLFAWCRSSAEWKFLLAFTVI